MNSAEAFLKNYRALTDDFHALDARAQQDVRRRLSDLAEGALPNSDPGSGWGIFFDRLNSDVVPEVREAVDSGQPETALNPDAYVRHNLNSTFGMSGDSYRVTSWGVQGEQESLMIYAGGPADARSQANFPSSATVSIVRINIGAKDLDPTSPLARSLHLD